MAVRAFDCNNCLTPYIFKRTTSRWWVINGLSNKVQLKIIQVGPVGIKVFTDIVRQSFYFCILDNNPEYHEVSKGCLSSIFILFNVHSLHSIWSVLNKWKSDFGSFACFPQFTKEHTQSPPLPPSACRMLLLLYGWALPTMWMQEAQPYRQCVLSRLVVSNSATPWTVACQALLSMGILQARILE